MTWRGVEFNNGIRAAAGLAVSYTRGVAQRDYLGNTIAADTPIYDSPRALPAPRPATVTLGTTTGNTGVVMYLLGAGRTPDGREFVCYRRKNTSSNSPENIVIKISPDYSASSFDDVTPSATNLVFDISNASGSANILKNSTLAVGGSTRNSTTRYIPIVGNVLGSTIVVLCQGIDVGSSEYRYTAAVTYNWTTAQWELLFQSPSYNASTTNSRLNTWGRPQFCFPDRDQTTALDAYLVFWDYMGTANKTYSGMMFAAPMRRASTSAAWEIGQVAPIVSISDTPHVDYANIPSTRGGHAHFGWITRYGAGGLYLVYGDAHSTIASVRLYHRADTNILDGYSGIRTGTTLSRTTAYFGTVDVDPALSAASTFGTTETDGTTANGWTLRRFAYGNPSLTNGQYGPNTMSIAPIGTNPREFVAGADETIVPMSKWYLPATATDKITSGDLISGPSILAGQPFRSVRCWGFAERADWAGLAMLLRPSNIDASAVSNVSAAGNWTNRACANVMLYSIDGERWARWARPSKTISSDGAYDPNLSYVVTPTGRILMAFDRRSDGTNTGEAIIDLGAPVIRYARPILTSPTVYQHADSTSTSASGVASISDVTSTYTNAGAISGGRTLPAAPCGGKVYRLTSAGGSAGAGLFRFQAAVSETVPGGKYALRLWVLELPPSIPFVNDSTAPYNTSGTFQIKADIYTTSNGNRSTTQYTLKPAAQGVWVPYVLYIDRSQTSDFASGTAITAPAAISMSVTNPGLGAGVNTRSVDFLVAVELCHAGASADIPTIPATFVSGTKQRIPGTYLAVGGFTPSSTWHFAASGMIPASAWDSFVIDARRPANRRLLTLWQDAGNYLFVQADTVNSALLFKGRRTVQVTQVTVSSTTATVYAPGHGFANGMTVKFTGFTQNGGTTADSFTVASAATDTFTVTVASSTTTLQTGDITVYTDYSTTASAVSTERFEFYRQGMIHLMISQGSSGAMAFTASVDGTAMSRTTATWSGFALKPTDCILADEGIAAMEPMAWHLVAMDENGSGSYSTASAAQSFMASESIRDAAYPQTRRVFIAA